MQGTGTGKLVMHEWVVEQQLLEAFRLSRDLQQGDARSADNEWGKLEQSLELYTGAFLKSLVCTPFGDFLPEQRS